MKLDHVVSASQFNVAALQKIFKLTDQIKNGKYNKKALDGKIMATLFYEPSTRTRLSFESAMLRLGGAVIGTENAAEFSSAVKGETLEDTVRVVSCFADVIVLRHFNAGASEIAASYTKVPLINGGDGNGEHPTQALYDLYTIFSRFKQVKGNIVMVGDLLNGRTIHSLSLLLSLYPKVRITYVSPEELAIPQNLRDLLTRRKVDFTETEKMEDAIKEADVIYQTRIQKERFKTESVYLKYFGRYILDKNSLKLLKKECIILHPLPRINEISPEVDNDPRAYYFQQVQNGLYVRMALLLFLFDKAQG